MLDARSGQLLTSQSFKDAFSNLQFAGEGVSYLLHRAGNPGQENIELHHYSPVTDRDTLVTRYTHWPQAKARPSLWRGSLSPDSALLVYQEDTLKPVVTVVDGKDGNRVSEIRWDSDRSALPVHIDPKNELIAIPLARWDARYAYETDRKLLVAHLKSGRILGQYDLPHHLSQVLFQENRLVLIDNTYRVGHLEIGSQAIAWKVNEELQQPGVHHHLMSNEQATGYFTRKNGDDAGEFRLLSRDGTVTKNRHTMDKGFMPVGLRGGMLVSEKHTSREFPEWVQKLNEQFNTLCGRYAVSPLTYTMRYQDMATGALLTEFRSEPRNMNDYATRYNAGESRLAAIFIDHDHLRVEFSEVFPFWTSWSIALLAMAVTTVVLGLGAVGWHRWKC